MIYAIEALTPSFNATRKLLFEPFRLIEWLRLGLVAFLSGYSVTSGGGKLNLPDNSRHSSSGSSGIPSPDQITHFFRDNVSIIIALTAIFIFVILVLAVIGNVLAYVFIEALVTRRLQLVEGFHRHLNKGLLLLLLNFCLSLVMIAGLVLIMLPFFPMLKSLMQNPSKDALLGLIGGSLLFILLFIGLIIIFAILFGLTMNLAVPISYLREINVWQAWFSLISLLGKNFSQFLGYLAGKFALGIAATSLMLIAYIPLLIIIIPFIAFFAFGLIIFKGNSIMLVLFVMLMIMVALLVAYLAAVVFLPVTAFIKYYDLTFLQLCDSTLDFGIFRKDEPVQKVVEDEAFPNMEYS